ncbi:MAG: hypothetical protein ACI8RZ_005798 [Myxococcota bacterium]|jgi:hypothetical protein
MAHIVQCIEPDSLPIQIQLELQDGELFSVFLLSDASTSPGGLRSTILCKADVDPPPEAAMIFEVAIYDPGTGDPVTMRVRRLGSSLNTDLVRPHVRSRVTPGTEVRSGSRLEVVLPDLRRVSFTLQLEAEIHQGASSSIGGGAIRHKQAVAGGDTAYYLYNTVRSILTINIQFLIARVTSALTRLGIPTWIIPLAVTGLLVFGGLAYFAYRQHQAAAAAEGQTALVEDELAESQAAAAAAAADVNACLQQRQALALQLNDIKEQMKAQVEVALVTPFTYGVALGEGGARMGEDDVVEYDRQLQESVINRVVDMMGDLSGVPSEAENCFSHEAVLVPDLPGYILLWHPNPELVCPLEYAAVDNGIDRAGRWGLSLRVKRQQSAESEIAPSDPTDPTLADLRMADRWSARTHALGMRDVQEALLTSDAGNRVPVAPSQAHLWTLALWDAYNRMPSPADGVLDSPVNICITELMDQVLRSAPPAEPGSPLLPNIVSIASGEDKILLSPTPGCPWPDGAIQKGANAALMAVAHTANYTSEGGASGE